MTHPRNTATVVTVTDATEVASVVRHSDGLCVEAATNGFPVHGTMDVRIDYCRGQHPCFEIIGIVHGS